MFRIRQIHDAVSAENQRALDAVLHMYQEAFAYYPEYATKIAHLLKSSSMHDFNIVLLVAEGAKNRVLGFALSFHFPNLKYAYLDYLVSDPKRSKRGYGTALYEAMREWAVQTHCKGLFLDVPPDDAEKLKDQSLLPINKKRMAFYEKLGARPIIETSYDSVTHKANQGYFTYLLYDDLGTQTPLKANSLKLVIKRILGIKGKMGENDPKISHILNSIKGTHIKLRDNRYTAKSEPNKKLFYPLDLITTGDAHQIHHLREKGYVERPARVAPIRKGLQEFVLKEYPIKHFGEKYITAVHSPSLVKFLKKGETELEPGQMVYPNIFPIRRPDRIPKSWEMQAGYYCMDTFTPVTANAYRAARSAADAALTGAERIEKGASHCYILCRPPGHHAESKAFGGFCYLNSAAIAANYLSHSGTVAFIDIDHHHGNGSQDIFYKRRDVYFISIHGHPQVSYPYFAGYPDERGEDDGKGYNKNFPLYPGTNDEAYCRTLTEAVAIIKRFKPRYLVVSLGMDIMSGDPTGTFVITPKGMQKIGKMLGELKLPTLLVQEGGYALRNLRTGTKHFFSGLLEQG